MCSSKKFLTFLNPAGKITIIPVWDRRGEEAVDINGKTYDVKGAINKMSSLGCSFMKKPPKEVGEEKKLVPRNLETILPSAEDEDTSGFRNMGGIKKI